MKITVTYPSDCEEITVELPARHEVCPRCEGYGNHLNPSIGEHAYSTEEFNEAFPEEEDRREYFRHGGIYDVTCASCGGNRVVKVIDDGACTAEERAHVQAYREHLKEEAEYAREERLERMYGC
jgi:hypothetical protein